MAEEIKMEEPKNQPNLYRWIVVLGWLAMIIFACHASTHMVGAGDTWVALACGRHFANHGVNTVEPFSVNSHKAGPTNESMAKYAEELRNSINTLAKSSQGGLKVSLMQWWLEKAENYPNWSDSSKRIAAFMHPTGWINQNWLTHLIFYELTPKSTYTPSDTFTSNALVYWKFVIYIIAVFCVYYAARLLGVYPALAAVFACFAVFIGRSFLDIRPAGFSNLLVAVFLLILILTTYRNVLYIWLVVPLIAFWCNVHGGYIYIFIMLMPFVGVNLLAMLFPKSFVSIGKRGIYHTIAVGAVSLLVSIFCNPFRLSNLTHTFVISISEHAKMWRSVNEWHPAFEWNNPVGTSFPFLILVILSVGLFVFWLFSLLMKPRLLKAPVNQLNDQKRMFETLSKISGWALAVFICWVTFISFSFIDIDTGSFFLCVIFAVILLLGIYKSPWFISLIVLFTLMAMWLSGPNCQEVLKYIYRFFGSYYIETLKAGYAGRYIYPCLILPVYVGLHLAVSIIDKKIEIKQENIIFPAAAAIVSFFLTNIIFNPFNLESFREITQYFNLHRMWSPAYEGSAKLGYSELFNVLYIVNIVSIVLWLLVPYLKEMLSSVTNNTSRNSQADSYQKPRIDLSLLIISAITVYMAVRSRRFIPIAGIVACPILAMLVDQMIRIVSASANFYKGKSLTVPSMPYSVQLCITIAGAVAVISFGTWWSLKFKMVYLDPWPTNSKLNSVFMRMTASDVKPFYACKFIKDNNLKGNMFNYWTEGGFIAWGQEPDPNTGKTPLQLFMDGRAQAAYEPDDYKKWSEIMFGGPVAQRVKAREQRFTRKDYEEVGVWTDKQLKKRNVWVVLMPVKEFDDPVVRGLEHNNNWKVVFLDNEQKLFVDVTTPQGKELFSGIFTGQIVYPNKFSENLVKAHLLSMSNDYKLVEQSLGYAKEAFSLNPSHVPLQRILNLARIDTLRPKVTEFCQNYFDDFDKNKDKYIKQDGYHHRIVAAFVAGDYLATQAKDQAQRDFYIVKATQYKNEQATLLSTKRW